MAATPQPPKPTNRGIRKKSWLNIKSPTLAVTPKPIKSLAQPPSRGCELKYASNIEHANGQLKQVDEQIAKTMQLQEFESISNNLQTIPGIGKITAAVLTNHLIDNPFKTANHWVAYAGLNPQAKESGTSVKDKAGITNYGNRKLRAALFMAAMVAYRRNYFPEFTKRMKEKRKPTKVILVAIMRKLAVIAYYLHKKGESFQPERYQQKAA